MSMRGARPDRQCLARDRRAGVAVIVGLTIPLLITLVLGAADCASVMADHQRARSIAEAAALAGARDLMVVGGGRTASDRALAFAQGEISDWRGGPTLTASVAIFRLRSGEDAVRVTIDGRRPSFFGHLLPPGGWQFSSAAVATSVGRTPLCVIAHGDGMGNVLELKDFGRIIAPLCLVHSNEDIQVDGKAELKAATVHAVTSADGPISPEAVTDSPKIEDPFKGVVIKPPSSCAGKSKDDVKYDSGQHVLPAGVHCGKIEVYGTATLTLAQGEHWFLHADLVAKETARVTGADVTLFFDRDSKFEFKDAARVALQGRESGPFSGFVIAATRDNNKDFIITSENVETLDGVVYIPAAQLIVEGKEDVARESAWTVLVAQRLQLKGNPSLFVNADYNGSEVPVPNGVGPRGAGSRLVD